MTAAVPVTPTPSSTLSLSYIHNALYFLLICSRLILGHLQSLLQLQQRRIHNLLIPPHPLLEMKDRLFELAHFHGELPSEVGLAVDEHFELGAGVGQPRQLRFDVGFEGQERGFELV